MSGSCELSFGAPADDQELAACLDVVSQALNFSRELADRYAQIVGRENFRVIRRGTSVAGGVALLPMGQHFGGRCVPMAGVAAVGIAPEHRASGVATAMMTHAVREMHMRGTPISTLYPATVPLYRRVGYEYAGTRHEITIPVRLLRQQEDAEARRIGIERIKESDEPAIEALYRTLAQQRGGGALERGKLLWLRVREPRSEKTIGYKAVNGRGEIEGYLYTLQKEAQTAPFNLHLTDIQFATPAAGRRLLQLLHQHFSMCDAAVLFGSPDDALLALMPERIFAAKLQFHWMLRIVEVRGAMLARGWSPAARGDVHLELYDDILPENNGRWTLRVDHGQAEFASGGRGDVVIDIRGLAGLYSGHLSPNDLALMGRLRVAGHVREGAAALATLGGLFAGPKPWMTDMF